MGLRSKMLVSAYRLFPFSLRGDADLDYIYPECDISCIINFYGRTNMLKNVLSSLSEQNLPKERFEVILIEDKGGTKEGRDILEEFKSRLNVKYFALRENYGKMGYSRNVGISKSKGKFILFLDDDTVIIQNDFLSNLIEEFETSSADAIIPHGSTSYCVLDGKYSFHDPYFPSNRCMAYKREVLKELGGFVSDIIGQEDVELVVRFIASGKEFYNSRRLEFLHPPLILNNLNKAAAVGMSFARLRNRYPLLIWIILLMNGSRYLPTLLFPISKKLRMRGKFSLGFLLGILYSMTGRKIEYNERKTVIDNKSKNTVNCGKG
ncbi:MAG: glycosyltransferase family 2 protein [Candidatus Dadabacteria bacterium]